jgi:hypothetical protein
MIVNAPSGQRIDGGCRGETVVRADLFQVTRWTCNALKDRYHPDGLRTLADVVV